MLDDSRNIRVNLRTSYHIDAHFPEEQPAKLISPDHRRATFTLKNQQINQQESQKKILMTSKTFESDLDLLEETSGMFSYYSRINSFTIDRNKESLDIIYDYKFNSAINHDTIIKLTQDSESTNSKRICRFTNLMKKFLEVGSEDLFDNNTLNSIFDSNSDQAFYLLKTNCLKTLPCRTMTYVLHDNNFSLAKSELNSKFWDAIGLRNYDWIDEDSLKNIHNLKSRFSNFTLESLEDGNNNEAFKHSFLLCRGSCTLYDQKGSANNYATTYYLCLYRLDGYVFLEFMTTYEKEDMANEYADPDKIIDFEKLFPRNNIENKDLSLFKYYKIMRD